MLTLRCTSRLLKRLGLIEFGEVTPTTRLGNWYANILFAPRQHLILAVSERTLLPVVIPAKELSTFVPRLTGTVGDLLRALGIAEEAVQVEQREMAHVAIGKTASRHVLGIMNEFGRAMDFRDPKKSLLEVALWLAETPCKTPRETIGYGFPIDMTQAAFGGKAKLKLVT